MTEPPANDNLARFSRQVTFAPLGADGQRALGRGSALIVGVGGLGTWMAELLTRAGIGRLRLVDDDRVEMTNIHRQALYNEADGRTRGTKALVAADRLRRINTDTSIEAVVTRLDRTNVERLTDGMDVILDGTDNFATRFLINDLAVKASRPWVMAGVVGAEAQTMTIVPPRTPCLRCVLDGPPPPCSDPTCRVAGVLGPAVAAVASIAAGEAMKILSGRMDAVSPHLLKFDLWANTIQRIELASAHRADCICCGHGEYEFLEP